MPAHLSGSTVRVLIGTEPKNLVTRDVSEVKVTWEGFAGDNHEGLTRLADVRVKWFPRGVPIRNTRQVSLVSSEELALIAGALELPQVLAAWLGANLELAGIPGSRSCRRARASSSATLVVEGENEPCIGPGKVIHAHHPEREKLASHFVKAAWNRRGLVGWVERPGIIRPSDTVKVMLPTPVTYSLPPAAKGAG